MNLAPLKDSDKPSFDGRIHTCPLRGHSTSFQLVDELGDGKPYAGLAYVVTDYEDVVYTGKLDATGSGKVDNHYCGPVVLKLNQPYEGQDETRYWQGDAPGMKRVLHSLILGSCLALTVGCSATGNSNTFTFTADLPPGFAYVATVAYVPAPGQPCKLDKRDNLKSQFNREWRTEYKPDAQIEIRRTRKGCELVLNSIDLNINARYGKDRSDFSGDSGFIAVRDYLDAHDKGTFNAAGESQFSGQCQWFFRTIGPKRYITKILYCKNTDAQGNVMRGKPFAAYTLDQLPGKTIKLKIKLADEEEPYMGDTWVQVPGGWKRCMGKGFEDQHAFCYGNYTDFSTFKMPDGRNCSIYPGCTENKEVTP